MRAAEFIDALLMRGRIAVCVGCGGVGKTTVAAALALEAARRGRRALVLTIDPARRLADALGVEVVPGEIAGLPYVGSLTAATNKGAMVHPLVKPEEEDLLSDVLKVPVGAGTINCGIPYIATGLIGNSKVAVAGSLTTGPELFMIGQALDVAD